MPRPEQRMISFTIDGREVTAPENSMLVDAAKYGDVEIPVFCYEPKLGAPVGACRMCLVEIEGIPKLQTGCSTAVKDGMVVYTQTDRVKTAQRSVVEFLLINHPLDCPVCDKGGECPLQDITFGWGAGISRFVEPKRHFVKPLELSPLVAIDRERCILCYRCVRFSQEVAEDYQLVLLERGAHSYVATFDGHPYVAPFAGNIVELCPVGALTSRPYRFRARPWDIEDAGSVCTLCPSQCNVTLTVRDERTLRVLARDNPEVDDGWLCDKGRFAYQSFHVDERVIQPLMRDGGQLRPVAWERALEQAAATLKRSGPDTAALAGSGTTNEEGLLLARLMREGLGSPHLDSRRAGSLPLELHRALGDPALQASTSDIEFADVALVLDLEPVDDAPILDLRLRKGARRRGLKIAIASPKASTLEQSAALQVRYELGRGAVFAAALAAALRGEPRAQELARAAGCEAAELQRLAGLLGAERRRRAAGGRAAVGRAPHRRAAGSSRGTCPAGDRRGPEDVNDSGCGPARSSAHQQRAGPARGRCAAQRRTRAERAPDRGRARRGRDRERPGRRRAGLPVPAAHRSARGLRRAPGAVGAGPARRRRRDRAQLVPHRGHPRARRRRLPRRGLRGEGGHDRAPRRAPAAAAPGDRAAEGRGRRVARAVRAGAAARVGPRRAGAPRWPRASCSMPCPSTAG